MNGNNLEKRVSFEHQQRYVMQQNARRNAGLTRRQWRLGYYQEEARKVEQTSTTKTCAWHECRSKMVPGATPYRIFGHSEDYCSSDCVSKAVYALKRSGKPKGGTMEVPAEDFGPESGVVRHHCDRRGCRKPITLRWAGTDGKSEYCSNRCKNLAENPQEGDEEVMAEETATENDSPIRAGKPTTKPTTKKGKRAAKKKAGKRTAEKKAEGSKDHKIVILQKEGNSFRGKRVKCWNALKNGMAVSEAAEALEKIYGYPTTAFLQTCVEKKLIKIS